MAFPKRKNRNTSPIANLSIPETPETPSRVDPGQYVAHLRSQGLELTTKESRSVAAEVAAKNKSYLRHKIEGHPERRAVVLLGMMASIAVDLEERLNVRAEYADEGERAGMVTGYDVLAAARAVSDAEHRAATRPGEGPPVIAVLELEDAQVDPDGHLILSGDARRARVVDILTPEQLDKRLPLLGGVALQPPASDLDV